MGATVQQEDKDGAEVEHKMVVKPRMQCENATITAFS